MTHRALPASILAAFLAVATTALGQAPEPTPTPTPETAPGEATPEPPEEPEPAPDPTEEPTPTPEPTPPPPPPTIARPSPPSPFPPPGPTATPSFPPAAAVVTPPAVALVPAPTSTPAPPARITDTASVLAVLQAPSENPFGSVAEAPAALPPKLTFVDAVVNTAGFVSARVDASGRPMGMRPERDPIPSLSAEAQKSMSRWIFDPARRGSQNVQTWAALRLDLEVEIDAPRSVQGILVPVTPATPVPRPLPWPSDDVWLEGRKGAARDDGTVPLESVDTPPMPRKTPWDADSYRGPFRAKFWAKVGRDGIVEKAIPLEASDPILLAYLRRAMSAWAFRPARLKGAPAESWNELTLSGQISYKVELKQIASLRRTLAGS